MPIFDAQFWITGAFVLLSALVGFLVGWVAGMIYAFALENARKDAAPAKSEGVE
jgi:hypothetical protein